jgi:hypothetical protein
VRIRPLRNSNFQRQLWQPAPPGRRAAGQHSPT